MLAEERQKKELNSKYTSSSASAQALSGMQTTIGLLSPAQPVRNHAAAMPARKRAGPSTQLPAGPRLPRGSMPWKWMHGAHSSLLVMRYL